MLAIEERPGGYEWFKVSIPMWYRNIESGPPYVDSIDEYEIVTWAPRDAIDYILGESYDQVKRFQPGEGRPDDSPRYPMPWEV